MWIISLYEVWKDVDNDAAKMHFEVPKLKMQFKCQNSSVIVTPAGETGSSEQVHVLLGKPIFCSMVKSVVGNICMALMEPASQTGNVWDGPLE